MRMLLVLLLLATIGALTHYNSIEAYAWLQTYETYSFYPDGFFSGLWHGFIAPFAFVAQFFDNSIILYNSNNTGLGYNLGFLIGICAIIGGSGSSASR